MALLPQTALLVVVGFLPSLFWLVFYLKKDWHPEPKSMLTKTFFLGLALAPLAVGAQWLLSKFIVGADPLTDISTNSVFFFGAALVEEVVKYLAIRFIVLNNSAFDEPLDAMVYMITAALGFAAIENVLVLMQSIPDGASATIQIWLYRSMGATFLHALSSAVVGYFIALSWFYHHHSKKLIPLGILAGTLVHFVFNSIVLNSMEQTSALLRSSVFLLFTAFVISLLFANLRRHEEKDELKRKGFQQQETTISTVPMEAG